MRIKKFTCVYMTFFHNGVIQNFFRGFDDTLYIQYHELRLINAALLSTMRWLNIRNQYTKIAIYALCIGLCI